MIDNLLYFLLSTSSDFLYHYVVSYSLPSKNKQGSCRQGLISHFQGWKDLYYYYTTRPPSLNTHSLLITQYGFIPLRFNNKQFSLPTMKESLKIHFHKEKNHLIYTGRQCSGLYCINYNTQLKGCLEYLNCNDMTYYHQYGNNNNNNNNHHLSHDITLIVIGNEDSVSSGALERTIFSWIGRKVIVLQYSGTMSTEIKQFIIRVLGSSDVQFNTFQSETLNDIDAARNNNNNNNTYNHIQSDNDQDICLILVAIKDTSYDLIDKTLFNIGMDMSLTDLVLLSHSGYVFPTNLRSYLRHNISHSNNKDSQDDNNNYAFIIPSHLSNRHKLFHMTKDNMEKFCGWSDQPSRLTLESSQFNQIQHSKQQISIIKSNLSEVCNSSFLEYFLIFYCFSLCVCA